MTPVTPGSASSLRSSSWVAAVNLPVNVAPASPGTFSRSIAIVAARYCSGISPAFAARARLATSP